MSLHNPFTCLFTKKTFSICSPAMKGGSGRKPAHRRMGPTASSRFCPDALHPRQNVYAGSPPARGSRFFQGLLMGASERFALSPCHPLPGHRAIRRCPMGAALAAHRPYAPTAGPSGVSGRADPGRPLVWRRPQAIDSPDAARLAYHLARHGRLPSTHLQRAAAR